MLDYAAFPQQRQALICQILQENGRVVCAELAARLQVSEHTIRRDLHELSREGFCKKVYGGAVLSLPEAGDYSQRKDKNRAIKLRIAQQCARLVKPGGTIFIDTGTTNLAMAEALPTELRYRCAGGGREYQSRISRCLSAARYSHLYRVTR